mgnify:CR=1 FL=1
MANRKILLGLLIASVAVSGCVQGLRDPDPVLVNPAERNGTLDILQGETSVSADVRNRGYAGGVRMYLSVLDRTGTVLEEFDKSVSMDQNETRRITITANVSENARNYRLRVAPVG